MTNRVTQKLNLRVAGVILALGSAALLTAQPPGQLLDTYEFEHGPGDTLVIENDYGRVLVESWERPSIEVTVRRISPDPQALEDTRLTVRRVGERIFVQVYFLSYSSQSAYVEIRAPAGIQTLVSGANPAVELAGLQGVVQVRTLTGFITARDLTASGSLYSQEGDIQLSSAVQPQGDLRLETITGSINCRVSPDLNLRHWLRSGNRVSWDRQVEVRQGFLEKQLGIGGPLLTAVSASGDVIVSLQDRTVAADSDGLLPSPGSEMRRQSGQRKFTEEQASRLPAAETGDSKAPPLVRTASDGTPASEYGAEQTGSYSLKVSVDWVYVNASVRERYTNRAVPDLRSSDFEIYEDGQLQPVERFDATEAPFNLLLLLDVSGSTRSYIGMIQDASSRFTRLLKANDRLALATFNSRSRLLVDFTNDRRRVQEGIDRVRSGGGTAFYDALDRSLSDYMAGVEGRKAIVVFTDGVDNRLTGDYADGSRIDFSTLFRSIQEEETLIYTIFLDTEDSVRQSSSPGSVGGILADILLGGGRGGSIKLGSDPAYEEARRELERIADQTGGRIYSPRRISDLSGVYEEIANDLRVQYTLGYHSPNNSRDGQWRDIEVKIKNRDDLAVRARRGYYAERD